jgi:catechol 2,3-dioxygenase-like lactoylglutathione lyase family enzyme
MFLLEVQIMRKEPMFLDHINRYVSDVDTLVSFYTDALGFTLLDRGVKNNGKKYAILQQGGIEMFISEKDQFAFESGETLRHIGFRVEDAGRLLADLKTKGCISREEQLIVKAYSRQFYVKDPDGFVLDFIEWTDKAEFYRHLGKSPLR